MSLLIYFIFMAIGLISIEDNETAILGETLRENKDNSLGT